LATDETRIEHGRRRRSNKKNSWESCRQREPPMHDSNLSSLDFSDPCFIRVPSVAQNRVIVIQMTRALVPASRGSSSCCSVGRWWQSMAPPRPRTARKSCGSKPTVMRRKLMGEKTIRPAPWILAAKHEPILAMHLPSGLVPGPSSGRRGDFTEYSSGLANTRQIRGTERSPRA
jgi:hypothetical protein